MLIMVSAICDSYALRPLQRLVVGPFNDLEDLTAIEELLRTIVLHDEMQFALDLVPYSTEPIRFHFRSEGRVYTPEDEAADPPVLAHRPFDLPEDFFQYFLSDDEGRIYSGIQLNPSLMDLVRQYSNSDEDNVFFMSHASLLFRVFRLIRRGGSALLRSEFAQRAISITERYPELLFKDLDASWQAYGRSLERDGLNLCVPPVLGIVLTRCARREAIPVVIRDLREEWANARKKVWDLLGGLRACTTLGEALEIRKELADASRLFATESTELDSRPVRILWHCCPNWRAN
jgi:hypothetical protein